MPKQEQRGEVNNFIGGLITEASPLNFPPNSSSQDVNFELNRDGSRQRRLGMDYVSGTNLTSTNNNSGQEAANVLATPYNTFMWNAVLGDPSINFIVVQVKYNLFFFNMGTYTYVGQTAVNVTESGNIRLQFAALEGRLVCVGGAPTINIIEYTAPSTFTPYTESILTRDLWGVYVGEDWENNPGYHSTVLEPSQYYNLMNQSWGLPRNDNNDNLINPVDEYFNALGYYPSNSEQVWAGLAYQPAATGQDPFERMFTNLYLEEMGATTSTAQGYFIIDALQRGTSRLSAVAYQYSQYPVINKGTMSLPSDTTSGGPTCCTDFAGRVFFGGFYGQITDGDFHSPVLNNYVFFSQQVKSRNDIYKCYQSGDPTSRDSNDVVDTDGGFIRVSGALNIRALVNIGISLLVFADNGVWSITGGTTESGFTATNFKVVRVSTAAISGAQTPIIVNNECFFWATDGIYAITPTNLGDVSANNLTLLTIHKFYTAIPQSVMALATGAYDLIAKKIRWLYYTGTPFTSGFQANELIFDTQTKAFSTAVLGNDVFSYPACILSVSLPFYIVPSQEDLGLTSLIYMTLYTNGTADPDMYIQFAYYQNTNFEDWPTTLGGTGIDAAAYFETGQITGGDSGIAKQVPYLIMYMVRTETGVTSSFQPTPASSCMFQGRWNNSNSANSYQWTPLREAYRYNKAKFATSTEDDWDSGYAVICTKNKLRGRGRSFSLYVQTSPGKECHIIGWNVSMIVNQYT